MTGSALYTPAFCTPCQQGVAINFVKNDDIKILRDIEQYYSTQIDEVGTAVFWGHWDSGCYQ